MADCDCDHRCPDRASNRHTESIVFVVLAGIVFRTEPGYEWFAWLLTALAIISAISGVTEWYGNRLRKKLAALPPREER